MEEEAEDPANKVRQLPDWLLKPKEKVTKKEAASSTKKKAKTAPKPPLKKEEAEGEWLDSSSEERPKKKAAVKKKAPKKESSFLDIREDSNEADGAPDAYGGSFIDDSDAKPMLQSSDEEEDKLPICQYGKKCFRKNPVHFAEFAHPWLDK